MCIYFRSLIQKANNWRFQIRKNKCIANLIKWQDSDILTAIDKICLNSKDLNELKYQLLIKRREDAGIKHLNDPKAFIGYSNIMDDVYDNIDDYDPKRKQKCLMTRLKNYLLDIKN